MHQELTADQRLALTKFWELFLNKIEKPTAEDDEAFDKRENVLEKERQKRAQKNNKRIEPETLIAEWHGREEGRGSLTTTQIIIKTFFELTAHHHPDIAILRYLRDKKWNAEKAFEKFWRMMVWRAQSEAHRVFALGERVIDGCFFESGLCYFRNFDREGRPVMVLSPGKYDKNMFSSELTKIFAIHMMETVKNYLMQVPAQDVTLVVDLSGFGMNNFDFGLAKALIAYLDTYYSNYLGHAIVLNAPMMFSGVWRMLTPLLDPEVVAKVHFSNKEELTKYIDISKIPIGFGGKDPFVYKYVPPTTTKEKDPQKIAECNNRRLEACHRFLAATKSSIKQQGKNLVNDERSESAKELNQTWWDLDEVAHESGFYHRLGMVGPRGKLNR